MNGLPYYKAYPRDFIEGTIGMSFELKCAYRVVLDLIYMQGGDLPDDARYISGLLNCSIRKWKSIRQMLIEDGKIHVSGKFLTNYRARKELETLSKLQEKQAENRSGPNKNKGLQSPKPNHTEPEPDNTTLLNARAMCDALGVTDETKSPGLLSLSEPMHWLDSGCDMQLDILPTLRQIAARGKQVASWAYCTNAIFEARDKRLAPSPEVTVRFVSKPNAKPSVATIAMRNAVNG